MKKKEFKLYIDSILNADTPEKQSKEIEKLWKRIKFLIERIDNVKIQLSDIRDRGCY